MARWQLINIGVSPDRIKRWSKGGLLHPRYWGVYAVGHEAQSPRSCLRAALLAGGEGAILSHGTAAHLWGLMEAAPAVVEITVVGRQPRSRPGLRVHRVSQITSQDVRRRHGFLVTSPARTVIDQAVDSTLDEIDRLVSEARVQKLLRPGELEAAVQRAGKRPGTARTRAFLTMEEEPDITRSKGERLLMSWLRQARLPQPRRNVRVAGWNVDLLWPEEKLVVEFDGYRFHGHRRAFENDRRKDVDLANAGYQVLRFTWRQLEKEPLVVIAAIARALGRRAVATA